MIMIIMIMMMMINGLGDENENENENENEENARITVLFMIADDKQGIYGDWEDLQFSTIYLLLHPPSHHQRIDRFRQTLRPDV